jgi:hypothetical protein
MFRLKLERRNHESEEADEEEILLQSRSRWQDDQSNQMRLRQL